MAPGAQGSLSADPALYWLRRDHDLLAVYIHCFTPILCSVPGHQLTILVLFILAKMARPDDLHSSTVPQESSALQYHNTAPKSPGSLAIQLQAVDNSIQTVPTDIPQGGLAYSAYSAKLLSVWYHARHIILFTSIMALMSEVQSGSVTGAWTFWHQLLLLQYLVH